MASHLGLIVGTRPEIIKMAPVYHALRSYSVNVEVIFSGQHTTLAEGLFEQLAMPVDTKLSVMVPGQSLNHLFARVLEVVEDLLVKSHFDLVLVHGDTTTAAASAIACFNRGVQVAHVEAGLRTGDLARPFPEELNRTLIARVSSLHFCPTSLSCTNLLNEGVPKDSIHIVGNTIVDALDLINSRAGCGDWESRAFCKWQPSIIDWLNTADMKLVLVTLHRRENVDDLSVICDELKALVADDERVFIILPVHKNPIVSARVGTNLGDSNRVILIDPPIYADFVPLMKRANLIITDSGGIQEEAFVLGKPLLILRQSTERPEVLSTSNSKLMQGHHDSIRECALDLLSGRHNNHTSDARDMLGSGVAAERIASICVSSLDQRPTLES